MQSQKVDGKCQNIFFVCLSVRHLTDSAQVVTMLNRFGHSISQQTLLEPDTAMCNNVIENESVIPPGINPKSEQNIVLHQFGTRDSETMENWLLCI